MKACRLVATLLGTVVVYAAFYFISRKAIEGVPSQSYMPGSLYRLNDVDANLGPNDARRLVPRILALIRLSPFANLVEEDVSTKPPNWSGQTNEYPLVKGVRLAEVHLPYANAWKAFLVNANLQSCNLSNAVLVEANLSGANLERAYLNGANLNLANLSGAILFHTHVRRAQLKAVNLSGAKLQDAHFNDAVLDGANLSGADLSGVDLSGANLMEANLTGASLVGAVLSNAFLGKAVLNRTNLESVDLRFVRGLSKEQIVTAITNVDTRLPLIFQSASP